MPEAMHVLVSALYGEERAAPLRQRFPQVRFTLADHQSEPASVADANALLFAGMSKPQLSTLLGMAPRLDWIHTGSAGFDWVMVPEVEARSIVLSRTAGAMNGPMAEFAMGVILRHAKRLPALEASQARQAWEPIMAEELDGATLGIVGAGAIGLRLAQLAGAFGMRVIGSKRSPTPQPGFDAVYGADGLPRLLADADVVVLATPLTPETRGMMGAAQFALMKPTAYLVNLARGALVVQDDLIAALSGGRIAGAWMDAFEQEPLPADHPYWTTPHLFLTPHTSYRSPRVRDRVIEEFTVNLERRLRGESVLNTMREPVLGY